MDNGINPHPNNIKPIDTESVHKICSGQASTILNAIHKAYNE